PGRRGCEQLADPRNDFLPVQLDVGHECFVGEAWHAVFQVEAGGLQCAEVGGDLLGHSFWGSDVERSMGTCLPGEGLFGRNREPGLGGDNGEEVPPAGPEFRYCLVVGGRDMARRMNSYRKRRASELLQGPLKQLRERSEPRRVAADDGQREPEPEPGG